MKLHPNDEKRLKEIQYFDAKDQAMAEAVKRTAASDDLFTVWQQTKERGGKFGVVDTAHREAVHRAEFSEVADGSEIIRRVDAGSGVKKAMTYDQARNK